MAKGLHTQMAWEELAEDPFRGLRAGPATFSPFLFPPISKSLPQQLESSKWLFCTRVQKCADRRESEKNEVALCRRKMLNASSEVRAKKVRLAGFGLVQHGAWNNPPT
jgi:hypothetical protein